MLKKLEKYTDKFGGIWYKVNSQNCKNYDGCGIYSYHIDNDTIVLDYHITSDMNITQATIKEIINIGLDYDTTELLRASCWEIQLFDKKNNKWK